MGGTGANGWEPIAVRTNGAGGPDESNDGGPGAAVLEFPDPGDQPIVGPGPEVPPPAGRLPRLARHHLSLDDGHRIAVSVCGEGVPLVVVHGFSAEGILYAQTLSRLVSMGFKVVAIDVAGHGGTQGLPTGGGNLEGYSRLLGRVLDRLGIEQAVLAGHSMGGRLVTQLAALEPHRAIAVVLLDAVVGDTWDRLVNAARVFPPVLGGVGAVLVVDTLTTVPVFRDPSQAAKLMRLVTPTLVGHVRRPWRLLGPAISILRSRGSRWMLQKLAQEHVPVIVIHGDRDFAVPLATGRDAARRGHGELIVVHRASHSWLLKDPEVLPAIVGQLMNGRLGSAVRRALHARGVEPDDGVGAIEQALYAPDALVFELTPPLRGHDTESIHRPPRYKWSSVAVAR
jgi:pimeloyl-ACP methyl ester carboxylesterase